MSSWKVEINEGDKQPLKTFKRSRFPGIVLPKLVIVKSALKSLKNDLEGAYFLQSCIISIASNFSKLHSFTEVFKGSRSQISKHLAVALFGKRSHIEKQIYFFKKPGTLKDVIQCMFQILMFGVS